MKKIYFFFTFLILTFLASQSAEAQNMVNTSGISEKIEGLTIYPNPVSAEKTHVFIASKFNLPKQIEIFDVLGKQIFSSKINTKVLNITNLRKGVYIIKITESGISETRKLVLN